jgi:hypothetical protein
VKSAAFRINEFDSLRQRRRIVGKPATHEQNIIASHQRTVSVGDYRANTDRPQ